jgi:hypothetical protein
MIKQRIKLRDTRYEIRDTNKGTALLVVLFIVMAVTILSLGFLSRSDVDLACGQNMLLRTQMDYLAESGLEHAKGLILNPQDIPLDELDQNHEYWVGCAGLQLDQNTDDYYDVNVVRDTSDENDHCNYNIDCNSYRLRNGQQVGRSSLIAELRLDPVIALWTDDDTTLWSGVSINGDVRCGSTLTNQGVINGDVFANNLPANITGQRYDTDDLYLDLPSIDVNDFKDRTDVEYHPSDYTLTGNSINGMLLVDGDLTVEGTNNVIVSIKNLPALYVTGDLIIEKGATLEITGLATVDHDINIYDSTSISILGGLFIGQKIVQIRTADDSSGNGNVGILYNGPTWNPTGGVIDGALKFDGTDDYVQVENESIFDITSQITVSAWIKVNAFDRSFQAIATKGDNAWRIQRWSNTNRIEFACTGLPHNEYGNICGNISVNDGQWHHVAGVYDGTNMYLYIDGDLDVSVSTSGSINMNNYKVLIGENAQPSAHNRYWNGWIDDVRVYNCALDIDEIRCVRDGLPDPNHIPIGHWEMDESGSNVTITAAPEKTAILIGPEDNQERWSQAAGAFFRSIKRP